jgi:hypothetical protein
MKSRIGVLGRTESEKINSKMEMTWLRKQGNINITCHQAILNVVLYFIINKLKSRST